MEKAFSEVLLIWIRCDKRTHISSFTDKYLDRVTNEETQSRHMKTMAKTTQPQIVTEAIIMQDMTADNALEYTSYETASR